MKKYEERYISDVEELLKKTFLLLDTSTCERVIQTFDGVVSSLHGKKIFVSLNRYFTYLLSSTSLRTSQKYKICMTILENNIKYFDKVDNKEFIGGIHLDFDDVLKYLNKHNIFEKNTRVFHAIVMSYDEIETIKDKEYQDIIDNIVKENYPMNEIYLIKDINQMIYNIFKDGVNDKNKDMFLNISKKMEFQKSFIEEMLNYLIIVNERRENSICKEEKAVKVVKKDYQPTIRQSLTEKEYKILRKKVNEIFDIRASQFKKDISYDEVNTYALYMYLVYGEEATKSFLFKAHLEQQKQIDEVGISYYTKDKLIDMLNRILYYKDKLTLEQLADIEEYLNILNSELEYKEYLDWTNEILASINKCQYIGTMSFNYEIDKIKNYLKTIDYGTILK